jgi:hypothetical protein
MSKWFRISDFVFRVSQASALVFLMLALCPSRAAAHLVTTGMGPVYDGIGHLLLTPEDLVPVLAIALYAGLRGVVAGRRAMLLLPVAWFAGGLAGSAVNTATSLPIPAISFLILGGLVAADLCVPVAAVTGLATALGADPWISQRDRFARWPGTLGLLGSDNALCPCDLGFGLCRLAQEALGSCGGPVAGSWVTAIRLLTFGWAMR